MNSNDLLRALSVPQGPVDVVLDTDTYNEIDDQFALSYLMRSPELHTKAIYAAPFFNENSSGPEDGMLKSYDEIFKVLKLLGERAEVYKGSPAYLPDEHTPVVSPAAEDLCRRAKEYRPERPLYVVAIGAITNIASAILMDPSITDRIVVAWLGGHGLDFHDTKEFNLIQDVAAARVVMGSGAPFVQLPCYGVVSAFSTSRPELEYWLKGKNPLADYLCRNTIEAAESYAAGTAWSRIIWDVTAVAWLLNRDDRFMLSRLQPVSLPAYDGQYERCPTAHLMRYVYQINRDALLTDLFKKLTD
ncbi:nucleoside hydrolase [Acutalibacter muris]|uniref:nucleoside hydrolase n=1 Tax=Acutalibacter muris TaxID=1796620 RepID=UPI00272C8DE3|nr:nucleoside hydrolase [Acutalibacter muris]